MKCSPPWCRTNTLDAFNTGQNSEYSFASLAWEPPAPENGSGERTASGVRSGFMGRQGTELIDKGLVTPSTEYAFRVRTPWPNWR